MTTDFLRISLSPHHNNKSTFNYLITFNNAHSKRRRGLHFPRPRRLPNLILAKAVEFKPPSRTSPEIQQPCRDDSSVLLDVTGMMCGSCVSRVKTILSSDDRVDSAVVNMLTETAAIKLKPEAIISGSVVAEEFVRKLTDCGFPAKRRASGLGIEEKVRKWKETVANKDALMVESRNRVAFAWTLVALCCGSHATHILHSVGIHIGHGIGTSFKTQIYSFSLSLLNFL